MSALYTEETLLQTIFITLIVGCGCAWQAGRSIALTWRPLSSVIRAMILLGFAVRFLHFALFQETLFAPLAYVFETTKKAVPVSRDPKITRLADLSRAKNAAYPAIEREIIGVVEYRHLEVDFGNAENRQGEIRFCGKAVLVSDDPLRVPEREIHG